MKELKQLFSNIIREIPLYFFCKNSMLKLRNLLFIVTYHSSIFSYLRKVCRIPWLYIFLAALDAATILGAKQVRGIHNNNWLVHFMLYIMIRHISRYVHRH